ncbi:DNA polymerase I [Mangrovitalea sediminis]|uniref:DNA polymerase I n=1 Tax=Mangrovitalea sediminis TaxID=1982043 RepID=UPI000BE5C5C9|nr:DNA polymerase I [Mangrovitalea sediminis]
MASNAQQPPVVLVDGSSYLFRAFHALPSLTTSSGQPTGAIKGVINMIRRLNKDFPGSPIIVVFDARGKNFRHELFPDYKAHRPPMPEELASQIQPIHDIIRAMGLPLLIIPEVEADDVIGTLAREATEKGIDTVISTGDKDMAQLVSPHVTLINTMTETRMDRSGVEEKFGVPPERIIDYLALVGDTVDNIPGVTKCGPKTAVKWLQEYGDLKSVMAHADEVKGKIGENLREALDHLPLSYQLATIRTDIELDIDLSDLKPVEEDKPALLEMFRELEFKGWISELSEPGRETARNAEETGDDPADSPAERHYDVIMTQADLDTWLQRLAAAELFAFDTETTSLDYMQAQIVGVSFSITPGEAAYVPLAHDYMGAPDQLDREQVLAQLKPLLEDPKHRKVGQNLKYDINVLANHDVHLRGVAEDTMLESYVFNSVATRHDMDSLALKYLGLKTIKFEDIAGKGAKQLSFNQIALEQAGEYAAEDADITLRLHRKLRPQLARETGPDSVYREIDMPLVPVLASMERRGTKIDSGKLRQQSQQLAERMDALEKEVHAEAGQPFNLGSPKQLQEILYDKLGLPVVKKTPKGQPSTAEPVLQELAESGHRLPTLILEYRSMSKLKSTYTDRLPEMVNPHTGRVHTSYHQAVAATGRLSSSDPNLQNIPIRTEEGRRIRQAFIAEPGYRLIAADYSQIELRIMAHLSGDSGLLKAFAAGEDIHRATAAEVFGTTPDAVSSEQRRSAKAINFGLIYGMSAFGLSRQIGVDRGTAQEYINRYFERYPGVLAYMDRIRSSAHDQGYVETLFGRRLYLPDINSPNRNLQQAAERTAINAPMQGTAADIIKRAMLAVESWLNDSQLNARMIMQVHDELILEVHEDCLEEVRDGLVTRMSAAADLDVPLLVEAGTGLNWDEAH